MINVAPYLPKEVNTPHKMQADVSAAYDFRKKCLTLVLSHAALQYCTRLA